MKNKKKLLLVSHCILNVRAKIQYAVEFETEEERNRKAFLKKVIEEDIQLMQLPCPEFLMYGGRRWDIPQNSLIILFSEDRRERC